MEKQVLIPTKIPAQVLTIGPQYKNHRGGIGAVIEIYSKYSSGFQYIRSHKPGTKVGNALLFPKTVITLFQKLMMNKNIKIVHIHGASRGSFFRKYVCFLIAKKLFDKKVIYHIHGGGFHVFYKNSNSLVKRQIKYFINNVDCLICLSVQWEAFFTQNFSPKRIEIISNIIDYPAVYRSTKKEKELIFLFLGYITQQKGIFDLLDVVAKNKEKYQGKIRIVIGGNGEIEKLSRFIRENKLSAIVEFVGWITKEEKANWLKKTDVYILPSYYEGLPISILEAMSYGHPIISTNVGGIPEIVKTHKNGILITPGNLAEIENAIDFFIRQPDQIKAYGIVSKQLVKRHLPNSVISELVNIYNS
nr:glycosyltransferase family 4 protein [uncultured Draconibacterium sp.]